MELEYCLKCYLPLPASEWELVYSLPHMLVVRCPRCRTMQTYFTDGTINLF